MSGTFLTVEAAAAMLQMHPKTVLRHIREGRLRAVKPGKQYRVLQSDLLAFGRAPAPRQAHRARVTSIVDIEAVDGPMLQRLTAVLLGASQGKAPSGAPLSVDIAHDAAHGSAKVIVVGAPEDTAVVLRLVGVCLEDAT